MKKFLLFLADLPTPQIPERFLRRLDQYSRKGNHHDAKGRVAGWTLTAWLRQRNAYYDEVKSRYGIQAAIALGY